MNSVPPLPPPPDAIAGFPDAVALFLDVDGTLLEFAPRPEDVVVPAGMPDLLGRLAEKLDGALALVSGRPLESLDRLSHPLRLAAAGVHGAEHRQAPGAAVARHEATLPDTLRAAFATIAAGDERILLEIKDHALALHCRLAPELEDWLRREVAVTVEKLGWDGQTLHGKRIVEVRPHGFDKGTAIDAFLGAPPFAGRCPVFVGDDVTDEDGFRAVRAAGGIAVLVGQRAETSATHALDDVTAVYEWLRALAGD